MSVLDEIKQLEKEIRETLGKSFKYGLNAGICLSTSIIFLIFGIYEGFTIAKVVGTVVFFITFLVLRIAQRLYETAMFNSTLEHAHDKCTCEEKCSCEKKGTEK